MYKLGLEKAKEPEIMASDLSDPLIPDRCPDPDCLFKSGGISYASKVMLKILQAKL